MNTSNLHDRALASDAISREPLVHGQHGRAWRGHNLNHPLGRSVLEESLNADRRDGVPADLAARVRLQPERGILPSHDKVAHSLRRLVAEPPRPDDDVVQSGRSEVELGGELLVEDPTESVEELVVVVVALARGLGVGEERGDEHKPLDGAPRRRGHGDEVIGALVVHLGRVILLEVQRRGEPGGAYDRGASLHGGLDAGLVEDVELDQLGSRGGEAERGGLLGVPGPGTNSDALGAKLSHHPAPRVAGGAHHEDRAVRRTREGRGDRGHDAEVEREGGDERGGEHGAAPNELTRHRSLIGSIARR
mmetsp:Transcript_8053/g.32541  ORF Transcript_8053/g.32541 Transcript_8053/m.32541 type:complete len:306 (+) Transcript_8053:22-939(+)